MPYGDIFVGTFQTIWRHGRLWLYGLLGNALMVIGSLVFSASMFAFMTSVLRPTRLPPAISSPFSSAAGALLVGGMCAGILLWLASYVLNLYMRAATICEAAAAWAGSATDTRRGLRNGRTRIIYLFVLDLLWAVPILVILVGTYVVGLIAWIGAIGGLASTRNQSAAGVGALLGFCGFFCCLFLLGIAIAMVVGIFQPLMYQSAVQGRRSLGRASSEGWALAASTSGPCSSSGS